MDRTPYPLLCYSTKNCLKLFHSKATEAMALYQEATWFYSSLHHTNVSGLKKLNWLTGYSNRRELRVFSPLYAKKVD